MTKKSTKLASRASEIVAYRPKPTLSVDAKDLPSVKDMKVGESCTFTVTAKVMSISAGDEYDEYGPERNQPARARLRITSIKEKS